jgi:hypothetical protein
LEREAPPDKMREESFLVKALLAMLIDEVEESLSITI